MPHKPKSDQRADEAPRGDPSERRRHLRVPIGSKARVLTPDGNERPCLVVNASAGGALLKAKEPPSPGERVVVYIDEIGRFEGRVVRASRHSFAVDYRSRRGKLQRTADALIEAVNNKGRKPDRRGTPRIRQNQNATVVLDSGETVECTMLDISLTGASIAIDPRPRLGELVTVGKMKA
ncbi:MAG: PilZ domain-containing protein [Parvularculaceae bacterium]